MADQASVGEPRLKFTRMVAHWSQYGEPDYLAFIEEAKLELVQLGFYTEGIFGASRTRHSLGAEVRR